MTVVNANGSYQIVTNGDMSGNVTSDTFPSRTIRSTIHVVWTGTPTGDLELQGSVDASSWQVLDTCPLAGAADDVVFDIATALKDLRVVYTSTSGTGTMNASANNKYEF